MLLHGVKERKTAWIMAWMVLHMISIVTNAIATVVLFALIIWLQVDPDALAHIAEMLRLQPDLVVSIITVTAVVLLIGLGDAKCTV